MAMIRGVNCKFPCPICLVPGHKLTQLTRHYSLRTQERMMAVLEEARAQPTASLKNDKLKQYGLRDVEASVKLIEMYN